MEDKVIHKLRLMAAAEVLVLVAEAQAAATMAQASLVRPRMELLILAAAVEEHTTPAVNLAVLV